MKKQTYALLSIVGIAALSLVGCTAPGDDGAPTSDATSSEPREMVVYGSSGAIEDAMVNDLLPQFEQMYNVKVTYVGMPASQALLRSQTMRAAPEASLVIANGLVGDVGASEGLWKTLDLANMPTLASLQDVLVSDGKAAVTGLWTVGIAYNHDLYEANGITPPQEWADLCDPAVSGRVVQYDIGWGYTAPFLYVWNLELGGNYDNFAPVMDEIVACRDNFQSIAPAAADFDQAFSTEVAWVGMQASMRGGIAIASGLPITMVYPESGTPRMTTPGMVPEGAPAPDLGEKLLDFLLTPEAQSIYVGTQFYVPVNPATVLSPEVAAVLPDLDTLNLVDIDWMRLQDALGGLTADWQQRVLG